jgi:prepilin-type N-terminal cleavage/methylation domain-containing protein
MRRDEGFTLIEVLVVSVLIAVVMTLGARAINHYWKLRALKGSAEEVSTELRGLQQDAGSQSHPWVLGAYFKAGTNRWGVVRGNINTGTCTVNGRRTFPAGVTVSTASFVDVTTMSLTSNCTTAAEAGAEVVFFFARGSATSGTVTLSHPEIGTRTIDVSSLTGRVTGP